METVKESSMDLSLDVDKLSYEIFSILENKFLFGCEDPKGLDVENTIECEKLLRTSSKDVKRLTNGGGKIRILSIDGAGATEGILAGTSLVLLEQSLREKSGDSNVRISDFFDLAAGSGIGGILIAMLFTKGTDGQPIFTADEALKLLINNRRKLMQPVKKFFRRSRSSGKIFGQIFGESTLKDTLKPVLIPCYDLSSRAPFVFSRADAIENDSFDFKMCDVCVATSADPEISKTVEMKSIDGRTKISAVDGDLVMNNPTAAAITHVLNNKQEFPFCNGVEDLIVLSLGNGESYSGHRNLPSSAREFAKIAGEGATDTIDQAVSMAFSEKETGNYIRIQANRVNSSTMSSTSMRSSPIDSVKLLTMTKEMLTQKSVESVLFRGKKMAAKTNIEKLDWISGELIQEGERRKRSIFPTVVLKQATPRSSSSTSSSSSSSSY